MKSKQRRWKILLMGAIALGLATALTLLALDQSLSYFYTPSDLKQQMPEHRVRLGGYVEEGSVTHPAPLTVRFAMTDYQSSVDVIYTGALPDLFREKQGIIAEGRLNSEGVLVAERILAKHDENYRPPGLEKKNGEKK